MKTAETKLRMKPENLCVQKSKCLLPFVTEVFGLKFKELPDYQKLSFMLCKILLSDQKVPNRVFDWSKVTLMEEPVSS
jgi:hypothetical protein